MTDSTATVFQPTKCAESKVCMALSHDEPKRVSLFIPAGRVEAFLRRVDAIQKKAEKLGLDPWLVQVGEKCWTEVANPNHEMSLVPGYGRIHIEACEISIAGHAPVLKGWRFLAKIEHDAAGNLVKSMAGGDMQPAAWHACAAHCDHCRISRARKSTFMLSHTATGEVKQVGSTCMADFLGEHQRDPEQIAALFGLMEELQQDFAYDPEEAAAKGERVEFGVSPVALMAAALKIVEEDAGYVSAEKAETHNCLSTGNRLQLAFWGAKPVVVTPAPAHVEQAQQVVEWLKAQKGAASVWLRNVAYLADRECITGKNAPLFGSGFVAWSRELQKQLRTERNPSEWVGQVGEKIATGATLERRGSYENAYGVVSVLSFRDEEGNALVWKTKSAPHGLALGSTYHIAGAVKAHGEYQGDKQTELVRVKVPEVELFSLGSLPGFKKMAALASPDTVDESGHTPLLKAVWANKLDHAKVLLAAGACANQLNQNDIPLLAYANTAAMAQLLIDAGARAQDVSDANMKHMEADARAVVLAQAQAQTVV